MQTNGQPSELQAIVFFSQFGPCEPGVREHSLQQWLGASPVQRYAQPELLQRAPSAAVTAVPCAADDFVMALVGDELANGCLLAGTGRRPSRIATSRGSWRRSTSVFAGALRLRSSGGHLPASFRMLRLIATAFLSSSLVFDVGSSTGQPSTKVDPCSSNFFEAGRGDCLEDIVGYQSAYYLRAGKDNHSRSFQRV